MSSILWIYFVSSWTVALVFVGSWPPSTISWGPRIGVKCPCIIKSLLVLMFVASISSLGEFIVPAGYLMTWRGTDVEFPGQCHSVDFSGLPLDSHRYNINTFVTIRINLFNKKWYYVIAVDSGVDQWVKASFIPNIQLDVIHLQEVIDSCSIL